MSLRAVRLFYSYCQQDQALRDKLDQHLKLMQRQGLLAPWHNRDIQAGEDFRGQIDRNLGAADIVLLLVSDAFISSDYCWDVEMKRALELHQAGKTYVIPVLLRPVAGLANAPFGKLKGLPNGDKPVTEWDDRDRAFVNIAEGVRKVAESLRSQPGWGTDSPQQPSSTATAAPAEATVPLQTASLRKFVEQVLSIEGDFNTFCTEQFPDAFERFSNGMDRKQKLSLLLQIVKRDGEEQKLLDDLMREFPKAYHRHEALLRSA